MYSILCDGELLYSPNVVDVYPVSEAVLRQELNRADSLTFKMYQNHPLYGKINLMKSTLVVYDGNEPISILRPISRERDFQNNLKYTCEGCLAFFNDSIVPEYSYPGQYDGTIEQYLHWLFANHNSQVLNDRKLKYTGGTGEPTIFDPGTKFDSNNYIVRANSSYPNTWDELCDKVLDLLGGYLLPKYIANPDGSVEFWVEFRAESGATGDQVIEFNRNLIDFSELIDRTDRYSRLIPLGAKDPESQHPDSFLTISSVNGGKNYIEANAESTADYEVDAVSLYGRISKTMVWDDVTQAPNLLAKGKKELKKHVTHEPISMTVNAADLSYLNVDDRFRIGQINQVISEPHGINEPFRCCALQIVFDNLAKNVYTFGEVKGTLTRMI